MTLDYGIDVEHMYTVYYRATNCQQVLRESSNTKALSRKKKKKKKKQAELDEITKL